MGVDVSVCGFGTGEVAGVSFLSDVMGCAFDGLLWAVGVCWSAFVFGAGGLVGIWLVGLVYGRLGR